MVKNLAEELKHKTWLKCCEIQSGRIAGIQREIKQLEESLAAETKSSAGDKHETGRAMAQIEIEKLQHQFKEAKEALAEIERLKPAKSNPVVARGSLVKTNLGYFYLGISLGKISVEGKDVMTLTSHSPLGAKLTGLRAGGKAEVNGRVYSILEVIY